MTDRLHGVDPGVRTARLCRRVGIAALLVAAAASAQQKAAPPPLAYRVEEGRILNAFFRDGPVAAHLLLRSGEDPRLLVAFPAGNSGVGLWFARLAHDARWRLDAGPASALGKDRQGRTLRGITATVSIAVPELAIRGAALSSVRVLRDYERTGKQPAEIVPEAIAAPRGIAWRRDRLDGGAGYSLSLDILDGRIEAGRLVAGRDGRIAFRLTALTGEPPLAPLDDAQLLEPGAARDATARNALAFLSYREKFLAGSWRFDTYFGRDTLMSVRLLMPVLQPQAVEAGLASVLARLSSDGEVAHEEDIGEQAILDHMRSDGSRSDAPVYDYRMVDETPMLAPVAASWLLDDPRGRNRAAAFLAAHPDGASSATSNGAALVRNLLLVARSAEAFAARPEWRNLIALKPGMQAGNWRDSDDGLGGGRYAYDVNAILMPAALEAAARITASGLPDRWIAPGERRLLARLPELARSWRSRAPDMFAVEIPPAAARRAVSALARESGIAPGPALASLPAGPLRFDAIALDAGGRPIPVLSSDESFALLLSTPAPAELERSIAALMRPFPAGLLSGAGLMVANPAYAPPPVARRFPRTAYHGMVIWSWQQGLLAAGIARQLGRSDLPPSTRARLETARRQLWSAIRGTAALRNSELWSWSVRRGTLVPAAFGANAGDADESNAAQLWSTIYLGVK
jgi:hypothetical protein